NPMAAPSTTTTYYARVEEGACKAEKGITIQVHPRPRLDYFTSVDTGCAELTVNFIENTQYGTNFIWDFGDGSPISNEASPVHTYREPGEYLVNLTAQGTGGCEIEGSLGVILVREKAMAQFITLPDTGERIPLPYAEVQFTDLSTGSVSWFWDFGDGNVSRLENPLHTYSEAGEYTVSLTVTDESGCVDSYELDPIIVFSPEIFIPNVFTPNQDGVNDVFLVKYDGNEYFSLEIFDRWGRPLYSNAGVAGRAWNGLTSAGEPASEGIYYYVVKIGERSYTGDVTLMR
ncbi:MAG: PKD domain-containing protein, partial [Bacteroidetes bacterium]|nr:PKD domain-containing protein [Bacteroidota bacterium]